MLFFALEVFQITLLGVILAFEAAVLIWQYFTYESEEAEAAAECRKLRLIAHLVALTYLIPQILLTHNVVEVTNVLLSFQIKVILILAFFLQYAALVGYYPTTSGRNAAAMRSWVIDGFTDLAFRLFLYVALAIAGASAIQSFGYLIPVSFLIAGLTLKTILESRRRPQPVMVLTQQAMPMPPAAKQLAPTDFNPRDTSGLTQLTRMEFPMRVESITFVPVDDEEIVLVSGRGLGWIEGKSVALWLKKEMLGPWNKETILVLFQVIGKYHSAGEMFQFSAYPFSEITVFQMEPAATSGEATV